MRGWFECGGRDYYMHQMEREEFDKSRAEYDWIGAPVYYCVDGGYFSTWPKPSPGYHPHVDDNGVALQHVEDLAECEGPW